MCTHTLTYIHSITHGKVIFSFCSVKSKTNRPYVQYLHKPNELVGLRELYTSNISMSDYKSILRMFHQESINMISQWITIIVLIRQLTNRAGFLGSYVYSGLISDARLFLGLFPFIGTISYMYLFILAWHFPTL